MRNIQELSDSELQALYAGPAMIQQESGGRAGAIGPQTRYGRAEGMTQMLPATAKATAARIGEQWRPELMRGDTPEAAAYQERLGLAYLQEGIEKTGSLEGAFKYYHGGPDQRQWGPKTNRYAQEVSARLTGGAAPQQAPDLTGLSDDELMAMYQQPAPQGRQQPAVSVTIDGVPGRGEYMAPKPAPRMAGPPANAPRMAAKDPAKPSLGQELWADAKSGFMEPLREAVKAPGRYYDDTMRGGMDGFLAPVRAAGSVLNVASAPAMAVARPVARQLNKMGSPYAPGGLNSAPRKLQGDEAQRAIEGDLLTAFSAAQATGPRAAIPKTKPMSLEQLQTAKQAAYAKADNLGVRYKPESFGKLVNDIEADAMANSLDPDLHKGAASVLKTLRKRADAGQAPTLTDLDSLRKVVDRDAVKAGGADAVFGQRIRESIDAFIDAADPKTLASGSGPEAAAAIREARRLNTQYMKAKAVTDAVDSAELRADSTYSGGNRNNAIRQNVRPLIDPRSKQRIKNLTPQEQAAAKRVVSGSIPQNLVRTTGKLLDPRGIVGMGVQAVLGVGTGGASLPSAVMGAAATELGSNMTQGNVRKLLSLIGSGGARPRPAPAPPLTSRMPPTRLLSPRGAVGVIEAAQPPARLLSESPSQRKARLERLKKQKTRR